MSFKDFDELVARTPKRLPIGGRLYEFPDRISAETGKLLLVMQRQAQELGADASPESLLRTAGISDEQILKVQAEMLGDTIDEMVANGVGAAVGHAVKALTAWHLYGQEAAEQAWNSLGPTPAPNRAARRSKATATSTRSRASTTGTSSRKPAKAAAARPGRNSSKSGR